MIAEFIIFPRSMCGSAASRKTSLNGAFLRCRSSFPTRPIECKMSRQRFASCRISSASSFNSGYCERSSTNSPAVNFIVAKGVPSSCAAAAITPPKSVSFCSRDSAICVANNALPIAVISWVVLRAYILRKIIVMTIAAQFPKTNTLGICIVNP